MEFEITSGGVYDILGSKGKIMERMDVDADDKRNSLQIGTVIYVEGYGVEYVIVRRLELEPVYGMGYRCVKRTNEDYMFITKRAYEMKFLADKDCGRIQSYITNEIVTPAVVADLENKATMRLNSQIKAQEKAETEAAVATAIGKDLFDKYIPAEAQALIVARKIKDTSDFQSDYHGHSVRDHVILGWSKNTRDDFKEMRSYADVIPETAHLKTPSKDLEGKYPKEEHREKWSMGAGYYLKDGYGDADGWEIRKTRKYDEWSDSLYISIAKRNVFNPNNEEDTMSKKHKKHNKQKPAKGTNSGDDLKFSKEKQTGKKKPTEEVVEEIVKGISEKKKIPSPSIIQKKNGEVVAPPKRTAAELAKDVPAGTDKKGTAKDVPVVPEKKTTAKAKAPKEKDDGMPETHETNGEITKDEKKETPTPKALTTWQSFCSKHKKAGVGFSELSKMWAKEKAKAKK